MKKVYLSHNVCLNSSYDFNLVKSALKSSNYVLVNNVIDADTYIYAGCGVRGIWVKNAIEEINKALEKNPKLDVIATGCFSSIEPERIKLEVQAKNIQLLSFNDLVQEYAHSKIDEVDSIFSQTENIDFEGENLKRKRVSRLKESLIIDMQILDKKYRLDITKKYKKLTKGFVFYNEESPVEYVTITRGCPYKCSYCVIPIGRGNEYTSVPLGNIFEKIEKAVQNDINRILLLGDEIGNYGLGSHDIDLSILLDKLFKRFDVKIALRYLEPKPFLKHFETIKKYCENGKIELIYLPIQSGSNRILKLMNRSYQIDNEFIEKILFLRKNTDVTFYTNWMVGFNSETEEDFQKTIELAKYLKLQINMAIPFSERPNTPALNILNTVSIKEKHNRHKRLHNVLKAIKREEFEKELTIIDDNERQHLLNKIVDAENYEVQVD